MNAHSGNGHMRGRRGRRTRRRTVFEHLVERIARWEVEKRTWQRATLGKVMARFKAQCQARGMSPAHALEGLLLIELVDEYDDRWACQELSARLRATTMPVVAARLREAVKKEVVNLWPALREGAHD